MSIENMMSMFSHSRGVLCVVKPYIIPMEPEHPIGWLL